MSQHLVARIFKANQMGSLARDEMFDIYERYYDETNRKLFIDDLATKDYVVALFDTADAAKIQGFSTLAVHELEYCGRQIRVLFSGDTILEKSYWGQQVLPQEWCRLAGMIKAERPDVPLYWLLIVKGHRTYRLMTLFSCEHYPSVNRATPIETADLMSFAGRFKFGSDFDATSGLVRFPRSKGQLKPEFGAIEPRSLNKPDVSFFLQKNPGYLAGDELLCWTELKPENMRSFARKGFEAGFASGPFKCQPRSLATLVTQGRTAEAWVATAP